MRGLGKEGGRGDEGNVEEFWRVEGREIKRGSGREKCFRRIRLVLEREWGQWTFM